MFNLIQRYLSFPDFFFLARRDLKYDKERAKKAQKELLKDWSGIFKAFLVPIDEEMFLRLMDEETGAIRLFLDAPDEIDRLTLQFGSLNGCWK